MILGHRYIGFLGLLLCLDFALGQLPVRIDDTYAFSNSNPGGIQFGGDGWDNYNPGHAASRYNGSMTVTNTPDATIVFFFRGASIKYYSDRDPKGGSASIRIDGQTSTTVGVAAPPSGFLFQQLLWTSPDLDANDHQITISNVGASINPLRGIIGLDFFEIVPLAGSSDVMPLGFGPGASSVPSSAVIIDDSDGTVTYSGSGWQLKNSIPDSLNYLHGSTHTTTTPGDSCSFRFIGTGIWYFTDYVVGNSVVQISIDGGPPEIVNTGTDIQTLSRTQRMTWGKSDLSDAPHIITITHAGQAGSSASIDFFRYIPGSGTAASSTSSSFATGPTGSSNNSQGGSQTVMSTNAIVGASVGGAAVIALLSLFGARLLLRQRRKRAQSTGGDVQSVQQPSGWSSPPMSGYDSPLVYGGASLQRFDGQYPASLSATSAPGYSGHPEVQA